MSTATLTSLAMLKVHTDHGQDYLDYLRPFVLHVLIKNRPERVSDSIVQNYLRDEFGLEIPARAVQVVLKRLSRKHPLKKEDGVYRIAGELPDPRIDAERADAARHIQAVIAHLREFSNTTARPFASDDEAVTAICVFLAQFDIQCLRAYLRGTAIPNVESHQDAYVVLVSKYLLTLQDNPDRFDSFLVVVKGHMLANALLCPDLENAPKSYKGVTFYLDTPLLVRQLGLEGEPKQAAVNSMIDLLRHLGATVAAFSHSRDELESVIRGAANHIEAHNGRGDIVTEARRRGTTRSDLILMAGQIDEKLEAAGIKIIETPKYSTDLQIDETKFEATLDDEVSYYNPRAKYYDINSVRSIYVLRSGTAPKSIERAKAVLVTSNAAFAQAAYRYGQKHEESREVSSVITDFSLANMAWLKSPPGAPALPMTEVLAVSYAALQPSKELLDKYMNEIDKLEKDGKISARDHQLLRSQLAQDELMNLTLGEEDALTEQTITETLRRVTEEIAREENDKYRAEKAKHEETLAELKAEREKLIRAQEQLYWRCKRRARVYALVVSIFIVALLLFGLVGGAGLRSTNQILGWGLTVAAGFVILFSFGSMVFGTTVKRFHEKLETRISTWLIRRKMAELGLDEAG
jgi:hypothetical protein